jgi:hypothetical protein
MKKSQQKPLKKLTLHRETVRTLEQGLLTAIRGGGSVYESACPSDCGDVCMPE